MATPADLIRRAQPDTVDVRLCLDGALERRMWLARSRAAGLADVAARADATDTDRAAAAAAGLELESSEDAVRDATVTVTLAALSAADIRSLKDEFPPRHRDDGKPRPDDLRVGYNQARFPNALIQEAAVAPDLTDGEWELLFQVATHGQHEQLFNAVWMLAHRGRRDLPFD